MSSNIVNQVPYLRTTRNFPENDIHQLTVELNRAYVNIADNINVRTIGIFPVNNPAITGESWFITKGQKQQTLRQVYKFTSAGNIPHNIPSRDVVNFTRCFGSYKDSANNWYGVIFGTSVSIPGQVSFYITPTNIVVLSGAGAPTISSGIIVLEWMTNV